MTTKRRVIRKLKPKNNLISPGIVICYIATLLLAGFIVHSGLESPAVWGFLGATISLLFKKV